MVGLVSYDQGDQLAGPNRLVFGVCLAIPFLDPFTFGPSTPAHQFAITALLALLLFWGATRVSGRLRFSLLDGLLIAAVASALIAFSQLLGWAQAFAGWMNVSSGEDIYANLRQRNQLASLLAMGLFVSTLQASSVASIVISSMLAVALAATASRTGLVQLLVVCVLVDRWRVRASHVHFFSKRWVWTGAVIASYVCASVALAWLLEGRASILLRDRIGGEGCSSRLVLWSNVWDLIVQKPWTGWGWGNLDGAHFWGVFPQRFCDILDNAHNLPLHLAVELGIPLAVLICGVIGVFMWRTYPRIESEAQSLSGRRVAWGALVLMLLHSMLEYPLWYGPFQLTALVCVLVLIGHREKLVRGIAAVLAGVLLVVTPYALYQYMRVSQIYLPPDQRIARWADAPLPDAREVPWFTGQRHFAWLTITELTPENAAEQNAMARQLVFYSPEGRVVERIIDSYRLMGLPLDALPWMQRFKAAYPDAYADWLKRADEMDRAAAATRQAPAAQPASGSAAASRSQ